MNGMRCFFSTVLPYVLQRHLKWGCYNRAALPLNYLAKLFCGPEKRAGMVQSFWARVG